jgi:hypothetical protein
VISLEVKKEEIQLESASFVIPPRKCWYQRLKPYGAYDPDVNLLYTVVRPFTYLLVPTVVWVILVYG